MTLAVVARNAIGEIIKAWAKVHFASNALQAEATTILWALELTNSKKFPCIIVEGDSKICCYALNNKDSEVAWCVLVFFLISLNVGNLFLLALLFGGSFYGTHMGTVPLNG